MKVNVVLVTKCLCFCAGLESSKCGSRHIFIGCNLDDVVFALAFIGGSVGNDPRFLPGNFNMLQQEVPVVRVFSFCGFFCEFGERCFGDVHGLRISKLVRFATGIFVIRFACDKRQATARRHSTNDGSLKRTHHGYPCSRNTRHPRLIQAGFHLLHPPKLIWNFYAREQELEDHARHDRRKIFEVVGSSFSWS